MKYAVFDVETPNQKNDRMSAIGVSVVEDGKITDEFYTLVNPETYFNQFNVALTGITPESVKNAPTFPEVFERIKPLLEGAVLVAHNASFDMGVLAKCLAFYGIRWKPELTYACTCSMARRVFPELSSRKLNVLCELLGIALDHHNAMSDAHAAAELLIRYERLGFEASCFSKTYKFY